ncbi:MAG: preprotein translocase subunit YajC [Spirochaetia bacterium]
MVQFFLLQAVAGAGSAGMIQVGLLVLMVLVMYMLVIRPQQKRQKEMRNMLDQLKKGDRVVTIGGIHGQVDEIKDSSIVLRVDAQNNTKMEFVKQAISEVKKENVTKDKETEKTYEKK